MTCTSRINIHASKEKKISKFDIVHLIFRSHKKFPQFYLSMGLYACVCAIVCVYVSGWLGLRFFFFFEVCHIYLVYSV